MKIFYGICGYGMGHAGRSLALIERLVSIGHQITIFTFADAYRLLCRAGYQSYEIGGLKFGERRDGGVSASRTLQNFLAYMQRRRLSLDMIRQLALVERPDLIITDFEPLTALAAATLNIPCVSLDNQHRFCHPLADGFPLRLRAYSSLAGTFVRRWIRHPQLCIVAAFHRCPPAESYVCVDSLIRDRIARLQPSNGDHVLLYGRGELGRQMANIARTALGYFRAYGIEGVNADNVECKQTSDEEFARDLASCRAVICSAGHQLISEAKYFGKRLLVIPMPNQHEQEINARYARREEIGDYCALSKFSVADIEECLRRPPPLPHRQNGVGQVVDLLGLGHE